MKTLPDGHAPAVRPDQPQAPILSDAEFARRCALLSELHAELRALGAQCVLARPQRLVLSGTRSRGPSGPTDPALHIFGPDGATRKARTDGNAFRLENGEEFPAGDPAVAAARIGESAEFAHQDEPSS